MTKPSILIIGAGMAGLSAGCYACMNGFHTVILEQHAIAGGLCTAWTRQGYTFDISIHMLTGSRGGGMYRMWQELGVVQGRQLVDHEVASVEEIDGERFLWYSDLDRLQTEMLRLAPQDSTAIREIIEAARAATSMDFWADKPQALWGPVDVARFVVSNLRLLRFSRKWSGISVAEYSRRIHSPVLRKAMLLTEAAPNWPMPGFPMMNFLFLLAYRHMQNTSYALGGSFNIAQTMLRRFEDLGGELRTRAQVTQVLVDADRAVGVRLADGSEVRADYVISAGDGRSAIWNLLGGRYLDQKIAQNYREWQVYPPLVMVMLGVNRDLSGEPAYLGFPLRQRFEIAGVLRDRLEIVNYSFDPGMAPAGKSVVQAWYTTDWAYWQRFSADPQGYDSERQRIADVVIAALDDRWPGFGAQVEVVDVPTPVTFRRYTSNEQGSPDGWCVTTKNCLSQMPISLPGLAHFYMAGQWTMPFSGVPGAAMSGRSAIQMICHDEGRKFAGALPPSGWGPVDVRPVDKPLDFRRRMQMVSEPQAGLVPAAAGNGTVRVSVDNIRCSGCGDCVVEAPEVFGLGEDGRAFVREGALPAALETAVRVAEARCPEDAIHHVR